MPTLREQIRDAVIARLAGTPGVARVGKRPGRVLGEAELTALIVSMGRQDAEPIGMSLVNCTAEQRGLIEIIALVRDAATADDALETLWGEVESRLGSDWTFGGLVKNISGFAIGAKLQDNMAERGYFAAQPAVEQVMSIDVVWFSRLGYPNAPA